jgi:hypothetical protein
MRIGDLIHSERAIEKPIEKDSGKNRTPFEESHPADQQGAGQRARLPDPEREEPLAGARTTKPAATHERWKAAQTTAASISGFISA